MLNNTQTSDLAKNTYVDISTQITNNIAPRRLDSAVWIRNGNVVYVEISNLQLSEAISSGTLGVVIATGLPRPYTQAQFFMPLYNNSSTLYRGSVSSEGYLRILTANTVICYVAFSYITKD